MLRFFFFLVTSMVLSLMAKVFLDLLVYPYQRLSLFCLFFFLAGSAILSHKKIDFGPLVLGSSRWKEILVIVFWVYIFEAILLKGQWPQEQ